MSAWSPPATSSYDDFIGIVGAVGGAALLADSTPNAAAPDVSRVFFWQNSAEKFKQWIGGVVCSGGTATVTLWAYSKEANYWFKVFAQVMGVADQFYWIGVGLSTAAIPDDMPMFLQVTAITNATFVGFLIH